MESERRKCNSICEIGGSYNGFVFRHAVAAFLIYDIIVVTLAPALPRHLAVQVVTLQEVCQAVDFIQQSDGLFFVADNLAPQQTSGGLKNSQ